ncbi:MAG: DUF58 domain-containing protein [Acidobacteria bacterium]|nr:DUF58 domain-containing protein [Acidobacteriota bacterium]MBI3278366.1 DUF58 domain-containing protein [Acidobacteriota bacterium]
MLQRYLDPSVLASISGLELIAKTVVEGFIAGLHRSPDFGFSQEFAEYRAYTEGDDLRHVDWNVYARTERAYLKRYRGETNTQLTMLLDASNSMTFGSHQVNKLEYAKYLAASVCYLAGHQRDAAGIIVFDDDIRNYVQPSSRQGQLHRMLHAIGKAVPGKRTNFAKPFLHCQQFLHRRGMIVVISDFYEAAGRVIKAIEPLRYHGNEVVLFHVLDPQEIQPSLKQPALLIDMETDDAIEVTPDYVRHEYRSRIDGHISALREGAIRAGIDYFLLPTDRPLDEGLREYLTIRQGRM